MADLSPASPKPQLPPLPLPIFTQVEQIELRAKESLASCENLGSFYFDNTRAERVIISYVVASFDIQHRYYASLPEFKPAWVTDIGEHVVRAIMSQLPISASIEAITPGVVYALNAYVRRQTKSPKTVERTGPSAPFAEQLRTLLDEARMTQEGIAEAIKVHFTTVARHLSGKTTPRARQVGEYEAVFTKKLGRTVRFDLP